MVPERSSHRLKAVLVANAYDISVSFDFGTGVDFGNNFKLELYRNGDLTDNAQLNLDLKVMTYIRYGKKLYEFKAGADLYSMLRLPLTVKFNQATEKRYTIFTKSFDKILLFYLGLYRQNSFRIRG
jgi:hypothetical protein